MRWIAFLAAMAFFGGEAAARPYADVTTDYYADAAHRKWVGSVELTCGGGIIRYGRTSRFSVKQSDPCSAHRVSAASLATARRSGLTPEQACHAMCYRKFNKLGYCLPDGTCPQQEALQECLNSCSPTNR